MNTMRSILMLAAAAAVSTWQMNGPTATAALVAFDAADDSAYDDGWSEGDNGGSGFGAWDFEVFDLGMNGVLAGFGLGSSTSNGSAPSGHIDTGGRAFGLVSSPDDIALATRSFTGGPLAVGQTFTFAMDSGFVAQNGDGNSAPAVAVGLVSSFNPMDLARLSFRFDGDNANYVVDDMTMGRDTGVPFTDDGLQVAVTLTSENTYSLAIDGMSTLSGTLFGSGDIIGFVVGSGLNDLTLSHTFFVNSVAVVPEARAWLMLGAVLIGACGIKMLQSRWLRARPTAG
jgi:hypothetical protein